MQLLMEHAQKGKVFSLWVKYELIEQERALVDKYNIRRTVLVEGNPRQEKERAAKMAAALAVVVAVGAFPFLGGPVPAIALAIIVFVLGWISIYNNIRETVRVEDILHGRHFACRSIITLLNKKQQISEMAERFTHFLETLKNWGGREVVEMAPDRPPVARFVEKPHAAHAAE
ncbi:MAG: hypothetical protein WA970_17825 [Gammaproteobacteria bacterium]